MKEIYDFTTTKSMNGILRSFYNKSKKYLLSNIEIYESSNYNKSLIAENAFDYNTSSYWLGDYDQKGLINLSFCLKYYFTRITGFEMATSEQGKSIPSSFIFSSSKDNEIYSNYQYYFYNYTQNTVHYFSYRSTPSKCYRLTCIQSVTGRRGFDVKSIEIYGEISTEIKNLLNDSCKIKINFSKSIFAVFIILG